MYMMRVNRWDHTYGSITLRMPFVEIVILSIHQPATEKRHHPASSSNKNKSEPCHYPAGKLFTIHE